MYVLYVLEKFPNITETFILNEIVALRGRGIKIKILSVRKGSLSNGENGASEIEDIEYFSDRSYLHHILAHLSFIKRWNYYKIFFIILFTRKFSSKEIIKNLKAFFIGICFLYKLKNEEIKLIHAHFINLPTSIALYMSMLSGIPFSCTAHAYDIYKGNIADIVYKINKSKFIITCTLSNKHYLASLLTINSYKSKIFHVYHGIDTSKWPFRNIDFNAISMRSEISVVAVARLVEKKGLKYLIEAIRILVAKNISIRCSIIGDGPLRCQLEDLVKEKHLEHHVIFYGELSYSLVKSIYRTADFFVLPCIICNDGDRDGLPNVLLEAMAQGIPVISTKVSAIPELVKNRTTGLLVSENDCASISEAISELVKDPKLCKFLAANGRALIEKKFNIDVSIGQLIEHFSFDTKN